MQIRLMIYLVGLLAIAPQSSAYNVGDKLSSDISQKLNLQPDKVSVLNFFASWCVSCAKEIPEIHQFIKENKGAYQVVGIGVDEELAVGKAFQKKLNISYPVYDDVDQQVVQAFDPVGMPALYYVDDNRVVGKRIGAINHIDKQIRKDLKKLGVDL